MMIMRPTAEQATTIIRISHNRIFFTNSIPISKLHPYSQGIGLYVANASDRVDIGPLLVRQKSDLCWRSAQKPSASEAG